MQAPLTIRIHPADDVVIARQQLVGGTVLADEGITVAGLVAPGHKVALRAIAQGAPVRHYNQIIGTAKRPIEAGQHVHTHNLEFASFARDDAVFRSWRGRVLIPATPWRTRQVPESPASVPAW